MDDLEYYKSVCKVQSYVLSFVGIEVGCRAMNWNDGGFPLFRRHMLNHVCGTHDVKRILSFSNLTRNRALTLGFSPHGENLFLLPMWYIACISHGTRLVGMDGKSVVFKDWTEVKVVVSGCCQFGVMLDK